MVTLLSLVLEEYYLPDNKKDTSTLVYGIALSMLAILLVGLFVDGCE